MNSNSNEETENQNNLSEFEEEQPKKKAQNPALQSIIGLFFIGYGIFRLTNTMRGDGAWNTFYGWIMIISGVISLAAVALKK
jgi:uncharacterized membrane protein HdeD (DUF308 family)